MGKQSSNKKVQRAARAGGGRKVSRRQSSMLWPAVISVVVVLGILLIVVSRGENQGAGDGERPRLLSTHPEDHWHEAFGINVCGTYEPVLPEAVNSGIHTHGDGLIHIEATNSAETGANATIGKFVGDYGSGFRLSDTQLSLPGGKTYKNGDDCGGKPGQVALYLWDNPKDTTPQIVTTGLAKLRLKNERILAFSFNPAGTELEKPASESNLTDPNAGEGGGSTGTTVAPELLPSTSVPAGGSTPTTAAGGATPTTAAGGAATTTP